VSKFNRKYLFNLRAIVYIYIDSTKISVFILNNSHGIFSQQNKKTIIYHYYLNQHNAEPDEELFTVWKWTSEVFTSFNHWYVWSQCVFSIVRGVDFLQALLILSCKFLPKWHIDVGEKQYHVYILVVSSCHCVVLLV
jgi:hypothetical protein